MYRLRELVKSPLIRPMLGVIYSATLLMLGVSILSIQLNLHFLKLQIQELEQQSGNLSNFEEVILLNDSEGYLLQNVVGVSKDSQLANTYFSVIDGTKYLRYQYSLRNNVGIFDPNTTEWVEISAQPGETITLMEISMENGARQVGYFICPTGKNGCDVRIQETGILLPKKS